ncbi:MAG: hypothetical protein NVSMB24_39510 [Mucilaginibacter sp.]
MKRLTNTLFIFSIIGLTSCQKDAVTPVIQYARSNKGITTTSKAFNPYTVNAAVSGFIRVVLAKDSINKDDILIMFDPNTHPGFIFNEDARYFPGYGVVGLSSMSGDGVPLTIDKRPFLAISTAIALNVNATRSDIYTLNLSAINSIPANYDIWLMDAYKKDSVDFRHNPTYAFNLNLADTNSFGSNRFRLVIHENVALKVHLLYFEANKVRRGVQFNWTTENEGTNTTFVLEKSQDKGQTYSQSISVVSSGINTYTYLDKIHAYGEALYRLKVISQDRSAIMSKVVSAKPGKSY